MRRAPLVLLLLALPLAALPQAEERRETYDDGSPMIVREVKRDAAGAEIDHGDWRRFHANGKLAIAGQCEEGKRSGEWSFFWENGRKQEAGPYVDGVRHGEWRTWRENGAREAEGRYETGHRAGTWTFRRDGDRSTVSYRWVTQEYEDGTPRGTGNSVEGRKTGTWTYFWPDGAPMAEGTYERGALQGEVWFWYPDGVLEPEMVTGLWREGRRFRGLDPTRLAERRESGAAAGGTAREPFPCSARADLFLTEFVNGPADRVGLARHELVRLGAEAFPALLNRWRGCELDTEEGEALASRLHEVLADICGGLAYPWAAGPSEDAVHTRRLTTQRWRALWLAFAEREEVWELDLYPGAPGDDFAVHDSILYHRPMPQDLAETNAGDSRQIGGAGGGRFGGRSTQLRRFGGLGTEDAVDAALRWLVVHQRPEGHWSSRAHGGDPLFDVGVTAQALLALLGSGHSPAAGTHRGNVRRGVQWLARHQVPGTERIASWEATPAGAARTNRESLFEHCLATWALAEATHATDSPRLRWVTQRAVDHLVASRDAAGRWEFGDESGGSGVTGSVLLPLLHAVEAGIEVPPDVYDGIESWLDEITDPRSGRARGAAVEATPPRFAPDRAEDVTATVLLARFFLGEARDAEIVGRQTKHLLGELPRWKPKRADFDLYRLRDASWALFQVGDDAWQEWNRALKPVLLDAQCRSGAEAGSWDPIGGYGASGGRVLSTALMVQTLEVYYRYPLLNEAK